MRLLANFWFRLFAGAFFIGGLTASLIFLAAQEYQHALTQTQFYAQSIPATVVTTAFVDISIPGLQPIALNGFWSVVFTAVSGGLLTAICALGFAALQRFLFQKRLSKALSQSGE